MDIRLLKGIARRLILSDEDKVRVARIEEEYTSWSKNLTYLERRAIRKYTKNSMPENGRNKFHRRLNRMLNGQPPKKWSDHLKLMGYAQIISEAIRKHPTEEDIVCYRGVDKIPFEDVQVGDIVKYLQFVNTSLVKECAFKTKYLMVIHVPKGTDAAYIDMLSLYPGQFEVLIDRGYYYKIISKKENVYEMEVCEHVEETT